MRFGRDGQICYAERRVRDSLRKIFLVRFAQTFGVLRGSAV
jgi:hypothetical protein